MIEKIQIVCAAGAVLASVPALGQTELLTNPGFQNSDGSASGDGWGTFGNVSFDTFFGPNGHASFFADGPGNSGGVFQQGIAAVEGATYEFTLTDVRIEDNFNANFSFGLEFYAADDTTQLDVVLVSIDTNDPSDGLITGDGLSFTMSAEAVAGAVFVRPIILFDGPAPLGNGQANAFVFDATLVPGPGAAAVLAIGGLAATRRRRG